MVGPSACLSDVTGTQRPPQPASRSSCQCSSPQRRNSSQIARRAGKKEEGRELALELRPMGSMEIKEAARAMSAVTQVPSELLSSLGKKMKTADYVAL